MRQVYIYLAMLLQKAKLRVSRTCPWKTSVCLLCICLVTCSVYVAYSYCVAKLPLYCPAVQVRPSSADFPLTALASFPGSGNTWLRHLVQQATGLATGSVYCDRKLRLNGFPWECVRNGSVILIKTHRRELFKDHLNFTKIVILLRNPFDAFRAEYNRRKSCHTGFAPLTSIKGWPTFVRKMAVQWSGSLLKWVEFKGLIHVVHYEDLIRDLSRELSRLCQFLEIPVPLRNIHCAAINSEGSFHRDKENASLLQYDSDLVKLVQHELGLVSNKTNWTLAMYYKPKPD